jgi:formylmethanofuran dehydrogenase subunit E
MQLPPYFDDIPRLRVQDPLARVLGAARDGVLEYGFADAVRLAGHACPTVASAYWMTYLALEHLYPDSLPQRGGLLVEFRDDARHGNNGVIAMVVQMLTGAAGSTGFKGLDGRFCRAGLMRYRPDLLALLRFTRMDTRAAVDVGAEPSKVAASPAIEGLMARVSSGKANAAEEAELGTLWQARVRCLLLEFGRDPGVFMVRPVLRRPALALESLQETA